MFWIEFLLNFLNVLVILKYSLKVCHFLKSLSLQLLGAERQTRCWLLIWIKWDRNTVRQAAAEALILIRWTGVGSVPLSALLAS